MLGIQKSELLRRAFLSTATILAIFSTPALSDANVSTEIDALVQRGKTFLRQKQYEKAKEELARAYAMAPRNFAVTKLYVEALAANEEYIACLNALSERPDEPAGASVLRRHYAEVLIKKNEAAMNRGDADATAVIAYAWEALGDKENTAKFRDMTIKAARQKRPQLSITYSILAKLELDRNDAVAAEKHARNAVAIDKADGQSYRVLGRALLLQKKYDESVIALRKSLTLTEQTKYLAAAHGDLGENYIGLEKIPEAVQEFTTSINLWPGEIYTWDRRSELNQHLGHPELALHDANRMIELDPKDTRGYQRKAVSEKQLKRFLEAAKTYRQAWSIKHDDKYIAEAFWCYVEAHDLTAADKFLNEQEQAQPNNYIPFIRTELRMMQHKFDDAAAMAKATEPILGDVRAAYMDARRLISEGKFEAANKLVEQSTKFKNEREVQTYGAIAKVGMGDEAGAAAQIRPFLKDDIGFDQALTAYLILLPSSKTEAQRLLQSKRAVASVSRFQTRLLQYALGEATDAELMERTGGEWVPTTTARVIIGARLLSEGKKAEAKEQFDWVRDKGLLYNEPSTYAVAFAHRM